MFKVRVETDTIFNDKRITTIVATYPRIIHAEVLTHRAFCRNASSSRAIPVKKMIDDVESNPFYPIRWGMRQKGMQMADAEANPSACRQQWKNALDGALRVARHMDNDLEVHKSIINRLLEPFSYITCIITATEWANFFRLRIHSDAEPHMNELAKLIYAKIEKSKPVECPVHMPFLWPNEQRYALRLYMSEGVQSTDLEEWAHVSAARCARVSYLTHTGKTDRKKDMVLARRLRQGSGFGHWSPFEHFAFAYCGLHTNCPYRGWKTYRATQHNENLAGHIGEYSWRKKS
jgi:hypothetical protein